MSEPVLRGSGLDAYEKLRELDCPWHFGGGWAVDLFLGRYRREHKDADIAISYSDQFTVRDHMVGHTFEKVVDHKFVPWEGECLEPPFFQFFAVAPSNDYVEFLLETRTETDWTYRRNPSVTLPLSLALRVTREGVPHLAPAIALLFKSNHLDAINESDFVMLQELLLGSGLDIAATNLVRKRFSRWGAGRLALAHGLPHVAPQPEKGREQQAGADDDQREKGLDPFVGHVG